MTRELTAGSEGERLAAVAASRGEMTLSSVAGLFSGIPWVGGPVAAAIQLVVAGRQNRRLFDFLVNMQEDLRLLAGRIEGASFFHTEEFEDLAEEVLTRAADTRQQQRLDAYRSIFANAVTSEDPQYDEPAEIMELISRWHVPHIEFLRRLSEKPVEFECNNRTHATNAEAYVDNVRSDVIGEKIGMEPRHVRRVWRELYASAVVDQRIVKSIGMAPKPLQPHGFEATFFVTDWGQHVAGYMTNPADPLRGN